MAKLRDTSGNGPPFANTSFAEKFESTRKNRCVREIGSTRPHEYRDSCVPVRKINVSSVAFVRIFDEIREMSFTRIVVGTLPFHLHRRVDQLAFSTSILVGKKRRYFEL